MGERGRLGRLAVGLATLAFGIEAAVVGGIFAARYSGRKHRPAAVFPVLAPVEADAAGDDITVYTYGADLYADMLAAISGAQEVIYFETFIWKGDEVGQKFKDALIAAAERGVKVYITYDTFANLVVRRSFFQFPPSVVVRRHPLFGVGGYNIGALYERYWRDTHVALRGQVITELDFAFVDHWNAGPGGNRPLLPV